MMIKLFPETETNGLFDGTEASAMKYDRFLAGESFGGWQEQPSIISHGLNLNLYMPQMAVQPRGERPKGGFPLGHHAL